MFYNGTVKEKVHRERLFRDLMGDTLLSIEPMGRRPVYKPDSFN
jgi:hypothetical protein